MFRKVSLAVVLSINLFAVSTVVGEEQVKQASEEIANQAASVAAQAKSTLVNAIRGDQDAMLRLGIEYLLPAVFLLFGSYDRLYDRVVLWASGRDCFCEEGGCYPWEVCWQNAQECDHAVGRFGCP